MNLKQNYCVAVVIYLLAGCASPKIPEFVSAPQPPVGWGALDDSRIGCAIVTGKFELVPEVAVFQENGSWRISNGSWYDFLLLMPFSRVDSDTWTPSEAKNTYSHSSLFLESDNQGRTLRVTSPEKDSENFATHVFSQTDNDYACQAGNLVFPEFLIQGGTEGSYLSGKTYRQVTITSSGDMLFYEQTQSHKSVHRYYLFKSRE